MTLEDTAVLAHPLTLGQWVEQADQKLTRWAGYAEDREIAEGWWCDRCDTKGGAYHAFRTPRGTYLALAECRACGHVSEF